MWVFKVLSYTLKTRFLEWQRLFSHFCILLVLMKNDKLLVPNMFSVLIFKHVFSNLPLDYFVQPQTQTWIKEAEEKKNAKMQDICNKTKKTTAASLISSLPLCISLQAY